MFREPFDGSLEYSQIFCEGVGLERHILITVLSQHIRRSFLLVGKFVNIDGGPHAGTENEIDKLFSHGAVGMRMVVGPLQLAGLRNQSTSKHKSIRTLCQGVIVNQRDV